MLLRVSTSVLALCLTAATGCHSTHDGDDASVSDGSARTALIARDDAYTMLIGTDFVVAASEGVLSNDEYDADHPPELRLEEAPEAGTVTLHDDGGFTYAAGSEPGEVAFTYTISRDGDASSATVRITVMADDGGFTEIVPSDDTRQIYVSSSEGDDDNDCLSPAEPCQTISGGASKLRAGHPDHMYLKRGDVWRQHLAGIPSGRSNSEPIVVSYYGDSGPRPRLEVSTTSFIGRNDPGYIHIIGLELYSFMADPEHPEFDGNTRGSFTLIQNQHDILFEDNSFLYFEVVAHEHEGSRPRDLTFRRNIFYASYKNTTSYGQNPRPSNLYAAIPGLHLIENVFDHGGWHPTVEGAGANMYNHNIYLQQGVDGVDILVRGNIITRGSSHGVQMRSGGLAEDNFLGRNAVGIMIGYWDPTMVDGVRAYAFNNVVSEGHSMVKGHDACNGDNLCTGAVWGIELDLRGGNADWQVRDNVVANLSPDDDQTRYSPSVRALNYPDADNVVSTNNVTWQWTSPTEGEEQSYSDPGRTLGDYNDTLGGENSFDAFMEVVLNRPLGTWDRRYTAAAINEFIREGFDR